MSRDLHIYIRSEKSAKEAWDKLESRFEEKAITRKFELRRKLYDAKLNNSMMTEHMNYIKTKQSKSLDDIQNERSPVWTDRQMDRYRNLIATLEKIEENRLTWDYARDRMITEYDRMIRC